MARLENRHGNIVRRLTEAERVVLAVLDGQIMHGLDIWRNSGGLLRRITLYLTLSRMEERSGFPFSRDQPAYYELTAPLLLAWYAPEVDPAIGFRRLLYQGTRAGYYWLEQYIEEARRA